MRNAIRSAGRSGTIASAVVCSIISEAARSVKKLAVLVERRRLGRRQLLAADSSAIRRSM